MSYSSPTGWKQRRFWVLKCKKKSNPINPSELTESSLCYVTEMRSLGPNQKSLPDFQPLVHSAHKAVRKVSFPVSTDTNLIFTKMLMNYESDTLKSQL